MRTYIVGTPKNIVASPAASAATTEGASNRSRSSTRAPASSVPFNPAPSPCTWKSGSVSSSVSSAVQCHASFSAAAIATRLPWVSIAPFERPVVPLV